VINVKRTKFTTKNKLRGFRYSMLVKQVVCTNIQLQLTIILKANKFAYPFKL